MPTTKPPYPAEFKQQMVELVRAGRTPAELVCRHASNGT
jgi:transposase